MVNIFFFVSGAFCQDNLQTCSIGSDRTQSQNHTKKFPWNNKAGKSEPRHSEGPLAILL